MDGLHIDRLEALGFFRYAPDPTAAAMLARERKALAFADVRRLYFADAESLAEHGVRDFLGSVAPLLRHAGVPIEVEYRKVRVPPREGKRAGLGVATLDARGWLDPDGPSPRVESMSVSPRAGAPLCAVTEDDLEVSDTYLLFVGEQEVVIYQFEPGAECDSWTAATRATLALLNAWLTGHGSPERAYARYAGNDLEIVFLTQEMMELLNAASPARAKFHDGST